MKKYISDLCRYNLWATQKVCGFLRLKDSDISVGMEIEQESTENPQLTLSHVTRNQGLYFNSINGTI